MYPTRDSLVACDEAKGKKKKEKEKSRAKGVKLEK